MAHLGGDHAVDGDVIHAVPGGRVRQRLGRGLHLRLEEDHAVALAQGPRQCRRVAAPAAAAAAAAAVAAIPTTATTTAAIGGSSPQPQVNEGDGRFHAAVEVFHDCQSHGKRRRRHAPSIGYARNEFLPPLLLLPLPSPLPTPEGNS